MDGEKACWGRLLEFEKREKRDEKGIKQGSQQVDGWPHKSLRPRILDSQKRSQAELREGEQSVEQSWAFNGQVSRARQQVKVKVVREVEERSTVTGSIRKWMREEWEGSWVEFWKGKRQWKLERLVRESTRLSWGKKSKTKSSIKLKCWNFRR